MPTLLYLPHYNPDLNLIEGFFARHKALLRKAAVRTQETLWTTIGSLLDCFSLDGCHNYLTHVGYAPQQPEAPPKITLRLSNIRSPYLLRDRNGGESDGVEGTRV
jgi:hypothetical protein